MTKVGDVFEDTLLEEKLRVTSVTDEQITLNSVTDEKVTVTIMLASHLKELLEKGYWKLETPAPAKKTKKRKRRKKKKPSDK